MVSSFTTSNYAYDHNLHADMTSFSTVFICGMIEAVGHDYMEELFSCCESLLAENGLSCSTGTGEMGGTNEETMARWPVWWEFINCISLGH